MSFILVASSRGQEDAGAVALRRGQANYRAGKYAEAVSDFRLARFSSLEDPARHLEVLARLALAEDAAAQGQARDTTLDRFRDAERRYKAFQLDSLDADLRGPFVALFVKRFGREQAEALPSLSEALPPAGPTTPGRRTPTPAPARPTTPLPTWTLAPGVTAPPTPAAPPPAPPTAAPTPPPPTRSSATATVTVVPKEAPAPPA